MSAAGCAVCCQGLQRRSAQIRVHRTNFAVRVRQHVDRPSHRICGNRRAAGQRFQQDQSERVGEAGKHERVRTRVSPRQGLAVPRADEQYVGMHTLQPGQYRPLTHHHLRSRQIEIKKGANVLLHGYTSDIQEHGPRQVPCLTRRRLELIEVYTARPGADVMEPPPHKFVA
jgi:hypothetical protein